MRWPWHRKTTIERQEAEARADKVHAEVVRPLRQMRRENHLTEAVVADIRRKLRESGN